MADFLVTNDVLVGYGSSDEDVLADLYLSVSHVNQPPEYRLVVRDFAGTLVDVYVETFAAVESYLYAYHGDDMTSTEDILEDGLNDLYRALLG